MIRSTPTTARARNPCRSPSMRARGTGAEGGVRVRTGRVRRAAVGSVPGWNRTPTCGQSLAGTVLPPPRRHRNAGPITHHLSARVGNHSHFRYGRPVPHIVPVRPAALIRLRRACAAAALVGCTDDGRPDGRLAVEASMYPLQFVAERVGGDLVTVHSLTPSGRGTTRSRAHPEGCRCRGGRRPRSCT